MIVQMSAYVLLAVVLIAGCTTPAGGKWPPEGVADRSKANPPARVVSAADLRLQASLERDSYLLGEPVYLILRLENDAQARRVFGSLDPTDGAIQVLVSSANKREQRFVPLIETDHDETTMIWLAPGQAIGAVAPVFFGAAGWTFPAPGKYGLRAVYRTRGDSKDVLEVRSTLINIEVRSTDDGSGEFLVGPSESSLQAGKYLAWQAGDHLTAGREHLEQLMQRYPRSDLTHYARSALSRAHGKRFTDYTTRQARPPNCELALEYLHPVAEERLPVYVRMQNALTRGRCAARAQDRSGTRSAIQEAQRLAAERPEYRAITIQTQELERNLGSLGKPAR